MEQKKPIKPTTKLLLIVMASIFSLSLITVLLFFIHHHNHHQDHLVAAVPLPEIQQACKATRYPQPCEISLAQANQLPPNPNSVQIIQSSILVSSENLKTAQNMVQSVLNSSAGNFNITNTAKLCLEALGHSDHRIKSTAEALPRGGIKDARMWMSAGLSYQFDCRSGFTKFVNDSQVVNQTVSFMDSLINSSSNALSMLMAYDVFGNQTGLWVPPRTERDGFWEGVGGSGDGSFKGGLPVGITPNVTVCKGGACTYKTVQEAVDATPSDAWRFVIGIKEGVYEETVRIPLDKKNVVFLGDGMGKTVITGSKNVGQIGVSTWNTATVGELTVSLPF